MSLYRIIGVSSIGGDPAMPEILPMSRKERQRLEVIGHLKHGKTTVVKAAATLGLTERQMYRILNRYRHQGDSRCGWWRGSRGVCAWLRAAVPPQTEHEEPTILRRRFRKPEFRFWTTGRGTYSVCRDGNHPATVGFRRRSSLEYHARSSCPGVLSICAGASGCRASHFTIFRSSTKIA